MNYLILYYYYIIYLFTNYLLLFLLLFSSSNIYIIYYSLELQWMLLLVFFIVGTSIYRGLLNYLILNGWLSISSITGILYSNSIFLISAIFGKIGYYPSFSSVSLLYYRSSYLSIILDFLNKLSYFISFITLLNINIYNSNFDLWLISINFIISILFMKLTISIKHTIFISSFILFTIIYYISFLQDLLFIFTVLLFYLLFNINIIIYLLIFEISFIYNNLLNYPSHLLYYSKSIIYINQSFINSILFINIYPSYLPFSSVDLLNLRHYTIIIYMLLIYNWFTVFTSYPFILSIIKVNALLLSLYQSFSLSIFIIISSVSIYQSLFIRLLFIILFLLLLLDYSFIINIIYKDWIEIKQLILFTLLQIPV